MNCSSRNYRSSLLANDIGLHDCCAVKRRHATSSEKEIVYGLEHFNDEARGNSLYLSHEAGDDSVVGASPAEEL